MVKDRWLPPLRSMHEWSLVLFTSLAVPGAGMSAVGFASHGMRLGPPAPPHLAMLSAGLLLAALPISLLHLGRPARAPLALARVGRNALSTEVAILSVACMLALLLALPWHAASLRPIVADLSGLASLTLLGSFGFVYFLKARSPWRGILVFAPLVSGLATGLVLLRTARGSEPLQGPALALLALDACVTLAAWRGHPALGWLPVHPAIFDYRRRLLSLRVLFATLLPTGLLLAGFASTAAGAMMIGVLVDRFCFYGLARVQSTEAAVAEVERAIAESR